MLRNYITAALRSLLRQKTYSAINVAGFSLGIACCVLMLLFVRDEFSFDAFHPDADRIYRLVGSTATPSGEERSGYTAGPLGPAFAAGHPGVAASVRVRDASGTGRFTVGAGTRRFYEGSYLIAEQTFFDVFGFSLVSGSRETALSAPKSVVLTQSAALKYFGAGDPVGRTLPTERFGDLAVTGLMGDPPPNSHLQFSMLISFATLEAIPGWKRFIDAWDSDGFITYVLLEAGADPAAAGSAVQGILASHASASADGQTAVRMQPLREIHFGSSEIALERNAGEEGLTSVVIFSIMAIMVLAMACINYVNLATARALKRSREIGMRKVSGAARAHLVAQFLGESILLSFAGLVLAVVLAEMALPAFNELTGKRLSLGLWGDALSWPALVAIAAAVGTVSGLYPAWYLAGMNPSTILRTQRPSGRQGTWLRKVLVGTQFGLSVAMIAGTFVARDQLEYVATKELGFDRGSLVVVDINSGATRRNFEAIKSEMLAVPGVGNVSVSSRVPGDWKNIAAIDVADPAGGAPRSMTFICVDQDFLATFRIGLAAGRNISGLETVDTAAVLVNETAARMMGWDDPLHGEILVPEAGYRARVVGVVRDFHFHSLHEPVGPLVLGHRKNPIESIDYFTIRISEGSRPAAIPALAEIHGKFDKVTPFEFNVLDERIGDFYSNDRRTGSIFAISAGLAVAVACLGLLGLISYTTDQRTKEIGIRKVLGASVPDILGLLSRDVAVPAGVAVIVASPVAWLALDSWLRDFAYRVELGPSTFLEAALMAAAIAACTIGVHAVRAARRNPVESLRYE